MINIRDFEVNKIVLLISVLRKYNYNRKGQELRDRVYDTLKDTPRYLNALVKVCKCFTNNPDEYKVLMQDKTFEDSLESIFKSDEFLTLYEDALKYKERLIERWDSLKPTVNKYFSEVLRIKEEKQIKVNVVNPNFNTGTNNLEDEIFWGHYEGQRNPYYDVVYMMHESMHCMYPYQKDWNLEQKGICHALIELATDNELRCVLEGKWQNYSEGHQDNNSTRNKLLPIWYAFLGKRDDETAIFKKMDGVDFKDYNRLLDNRTIKEMKFSDLMDFCVENYRHFGINTMKKNDIDIYLQY